MLSRYDVKSCKLRLGATTANGYRRADLHDAWQRYLPTSPQVSGTSGTVGTGKASDVLHVPDVPVAMGGEGKSEKVVTCLRCDGIGCDWCERAYGT